MPPGVLLGVLLAQATTAPGPDAAQLERIRKALAAQPPLTAHLPEDEDGKLVFRVRVRGWKFNFPAWHDDTTVPLYVRPTMPPVHFEFLQQVTDEYFRASTLYPAAFGIPVVPLFEKLNESTKKRNRRNAERAAREEVQQELARLLACRADPSKPGC